MTYTMSAHLFTPARLGPGLEGSPAVTLDL
jgi:hypothetical protein